MALSDIKKQKILTEAKERLKKSIDDEGENRRMALEDLEFIAIDGKQWPEQIKAEREANGQPCLSINKLPTFVAQVVGNQRMNRPSIKVIPVDDKADKKVARILAGWIKHVKKISVADVAIDHGFEHAVTCGYGALRIVTKYATDTGFEQEAYIEKVDNALAVYFGPHSKYDCSDATYCFIISDLPHDEFRDKYNREPVSWKEGEARYVEGWATAKTVRLAEYFVKEPTTKTIVQLKDGRVVELKDKKDDDVELRRRDVKTYEIKWYLLSGDDVIDSKTWIGKKYIPVIPIWGRELNVGGKRVIISFIRNGKDPQRMYNYWQSCDTETVALQPRVPYLVTPEQISGHESMWKQSHKKSLPYLLVNYDPKAPRWPKREAPPAASSAMTQKIMTADQEMRDTLGLQKASLGMQSNERSGAAIRERKQEGDVGTFSFIDNLSRSIEHVGRVLIDIAPELLDTERIIRLGQDDGTYEFEAINVEDGDKILNDLRVGTYDAVVTVGPSFTTQRTEARQSIKEFIQYYPQSAPLIGDIYANVMDWPGAEEVAQRLEYLLPPELRQKIEAKRAAEKGEQAPQPQQKQPNPEEVLKFQEEQLKLEQCKVKLEQEKERLKGIILKNELMVNSSKEDVKKLIDEIMNEGEQDAGENQNASQE